MSYSNPKERELLARVERLEAELERLQAQYEAEVERRSAIEIELHAELERLRKYETLWNDRQTMDARLHRIEEAAREMFRVIDATKGAQDTRPWSQALRAVLESDD